MGIKKQFRAWYCEEDKPTEGRMIYFGIFETDEGYKIREGVMLEGCEIMQNTGLKDKNGSEIYEGDVLERKGLRDIFVGSYDDKPGATPFITENVVVSINEKHDEFGTASVGFSLTHQRSYSERTHPATYEIIGNIYENPELLPQ